MKCPNCGSELKRESYLDIEVDRCENCKGMWLDLDELDQLEDKAFAADEQKGSLMVSSELSKRKCPHCESPLREFQYHLRALRLDYCEKEHGFWLDAGEEQRVLELMTERSSDMQRKYQAEAEWGGMLKKFRKKSAWK
jgi:Zn-finger nucleic acid-binding protein